MNFKKYFKFSFILFSLSILYFFPDFSFGQNVSTPEILSVSISKEGSIEPFSVSCLNASSTNATAVLLNGPFYRQTRIFQYSVFEYMRRPCIDGRVNFDSFDLNAKIIQLGGNYPDWQNYIHTPLDLIVKDTTGLYATDPPFYNQIINLTNVSNNHSQDVYLKDDQTYKTLGFGSSFDIDEDQIWRNTMKAGKPFGNSSVLFLPGLEASRLYQKTPCNPHCEYRAWEPHTFFDPPLLYMDQNGESINNIFTRDIIDKSGFPVILNISIYDSLIKKLNSLVSTTTEINSIKEWKPFAYDWRYSVDDISDSWVKYENDQNISIIGELQSLINRSDNKMVTIVSHSNGGLFAKYLLKKLKTMKDNGQSDMIDHIDKVVFVATPFVGTPSGLFAILHGYDQDILSGFLLSKSQARQLAKNMPSAYGLIPSEKYYSLTNIKSPAKFDTTKYSNTYGSVLDSYAKQRGFLLGFDGRLEPSVSDLINPILGNNLLLNKAENLHSQIDDFQIPENIKVINIVGWGKDTLAGLQYTDNDIFPIYTYKGDKTVVSNSALYNQGEKYWLDLSNSKIEHKNIMEDKTILSFIENLIINGNLNDLSKTEPQNTKTKLYLSVHSPVNIGVYDKGGNFTGKVCGPDFCEIKEDIAGSTYFEVGEGKYVNVNSDMYSVSKLEGTGIGTFTYIQEKVLPNESTSTLVFKDIPVTPETRAEVYFNQNSLEMKIDANNDGVFETKIKPSNVFDPIVFLKVMKETVMSFDLNRNRKNNLIRTIDNTIKMIENGKIDKAKLKAENFKKRIEKMSDSKQRKGKKISSEDALKLVNMLDELLANLN